jgi:hypothetical protein
MFDDAATKADAFYAQLSDGDAADVTYDGHRAGAARIPVQFGIRELDVLIDMAEDLRARGSANGADDWEAALVLEMLDPIVRRGGAGSVCLCQGEDKAFLSVLARGASTLPPAPGREDATERANRAAECIISALAAAGRDDPDIRDNAYRIALGEPIVFEAAGDIQAGMLWRELASFASVTGYRIHVNQVNSGHVDHRSGEPPEWSGLVLGGAFVLLVDPATGGRPAIACQVSISRPSTLYASVIVMTGPVPFAMAADRPQRRTEAKSSTELRAALVDVVTARRAAKRTEQE